MKKKADKSIEKRYAIVFSLFISLVIFICWCANALLISKYYVSKKLNAIQKVYEKLDDVANEYGAESQEFRTVFEENSVTFNCDILVLDQDMNVIASNVVDETVAAGRLLGYFFDEEKNPEYTPRVVEKTDKYTMQLSTNFEEASDYLELWGVLSAGDPIVIRSAVSSIHDNAKLANILLAYIGIFAVIISFFLGKLVAKVVSKNAELELELEKRKEIDDMRNDFISNVSHELKTPIALIQGYAEGLTDCVNDDEESRNFYCEVIVDETNKMNKLVRNLLELNELEFGKNDTAHQKVNITELVSNCIQSFDMLIKQGDINMIFDRGSDVYVMTDEFKIEQVFNNYLSNAINHAKETENMKKTIRVLIAKIDKKKVRVSVFNSGDQIPDNAINYIWDKFYKVDKARTREYGGSGVGLSIVKACMETLNQKYGVVNCKDGVEFYFEIDSV